MHVSQVMASVPPPQRCDGHPRGQSGGGWLSKLLGR